MADERDQGGDARDGHTHRNRIFEHTTDLKEEAKDLATSVSELSKEVSFVLKEQLDQRPFAVLGVAAACGYVLGGGLPSRITRAGLGIAARIGMGMLVRQVVENQGIALGGEGGEGYGQAGA